MSSLAFYENSRLDDVIEENLANQGIGLEVRAVETTKVGGTDSRINIPATYVELLDKKSGDSLGRYLVSQIHSDRQTLMAGVGPDARIFSIKSRLATRHSTSVCSTTVKSNPIGFSWKTFAG